MGCVKCSAQLPDGALYCPYCGKKQTATERKGRKRANGEGSVFRYRNGWRAQIVVGYKVIDGKSRAVYRTKAGFATKRAAIEYLESLRGEPKREVPTLFALWEEYQAAGYKKLSESRKEKYQIAWPRLAAIQFTRIDLLTTADLQDAVNSKAKTYYPARDMRDLLSILFQLAMANKFVEVNLADYIVLPDLNEKEREPFTIEEVAALWADYQAGNWWTGYILLMCYTGMMPGELLAAKKESVDLDKRVIVGAGLKTETRKKKPIVLAEELVPVLESLMAHTPGEKLIRINKDNFYTVYYAALERAGTRRLTPYSCRHTAGTLLADANVRPALVQSVMRHASYASTQRYIHESVDHALTAVNALASNVEETKNKTKKPASNPDAAPSLPESQITAAGNG